MSARAKFLAYVEAQLDKPCLMGAKGDDAFDCSGLATCGIRAAGGPDITKTVNANTLGKNTRPLLPEERPIPGDLIFFDAERDGIDEHVGIVRTVKGVDGAADDTAIDAEGATHRITKLEDAIKAHAKVRLHNGHRYRKSFRAIHRNTYLDSIDWVTQ